MNILTHPSPTLGTAASEVDPTTDTTLRSLVGRMAKVMYEAPGIGLAAPQVGVMKRVIVFDLSEEHDGLSAMCNPVIVEEGEERETDDEGCLSFPGITIPIERACRITCEGLTLSGKRLRIEAEGLTARMFQHEIDHLDGVLIMDRATPQERRAALKRYAEARARP
ncbi:MAG: peptide deformylase [Coriobacteriia bacterium]|nr:peptide deformylase [Coriobacteriia bacterium]